MSFFGQLLAGAVGGAAGGYIKDREDEEKLAEKLQLRQLQYDQARMMQDDRQAFSREMALDRASRASGGGGKSDEFNPAQAFERAYYEFGPSDPRTQRAYELVGAYSRDGQGSLDGIMGRARAQGGGYGDGAPTSADVIAAEAYTGAPQPPENATRGQREALLGQQALMRFRAGVVDNGKNVDDFAKAETNFRQNDLGDMAVVDTLKKGGTPEDAGNVFNRVTNPARQSATAEEYVRLKEQELALRAQQLAAGNAGKADRLTFDQIRQMQKDALEYRKLAKEVGSAQAKEYLAIATSLDEQVRQAQSAPKPTANPAPAPKATISNDGKVATGKISGSWRDAMRASGH